MKNNMLHVVAFPLVLVGALNWGLMGLFDFNLVTALLGAAPVLVRVVYLAVGASAVYLLVTHKSDCKICSKM